MPELTIPDKVKLLVINRFGASVFSRQELLRACKEEHPDIPKDSIMPGDYCVNLKTGRWRKREDRFLFWLKRGSYRIYDRPRDGEWEITKNGVRQLL